MPEWLLMVLTLWGYIGGFMVIIGGFMAGVSHEERNYSVRRVFALIVLTGLTLPLAVVVWVIVALAITVRWAFTKETT